MSFPKFCHSPSSCNLAVIQHIGICNKEQTTFLRPEEANPHHRVEPHHLDKEKRLKVVPNLWMCPMLAGDISRVKDIISMMHLNELGGNGFSNTMKRQGIVMIV
jgi:hypothetical protein